MAALVTNLEQINALDDNSLTAAAVGGAGGAMPKVDGNSFPGIDFSNNCQWCEGDGQTTTANTHYSAWLTIATTGSGYDISGADQGIIVHLSQQNLQFDTYTDVADSLWLILFSGGGTSDYARWEFNMKDLIDGKFRPLIMTGTPDTTAGSWDNTDVTGWGVAVETDTTGANFGIGFLVDQLLYINGPVVFEDTGIAAQVGIEDFYQLLKPDSGETYHSQLVVKAGPTYEFGMPIDFQVDDYADSTVGIGIAFKPQDTVNNSWPNLGSGYYQLKFTPPASSTNVFSTLAAINTATDYDFTIDASAAGCSLSFTSTVFAGVNDAIIGGSGVTMTGCSLVSPESADISDGDLELTITDCTGDIQWTADLAAGSTITTNSDIDITFAETDLSDINVVFTASTTLTVNPATGSGTYDLSALTTTGTVTLDNATANNTTITLASGTTNTVASPTAGGGSITVDSPAVTFTINSSEASTLIQIFTTNTQTILDSTTGSSLAFVHSGQAVDYVVQKAGFLPQRVTGVVLSGTSSVTVNLVEDPIYNSGHGLTRVTDYDYDASTRILTIVANQEGRDLYSALIDDFISVTAYRNCPFPITAIGPDRFDFNAIGYYNTATTVGATIDSGDIQFWKGAGMEWEHDTTGNPTKKFYSIKSSNTLQASSVVGYTQVLAGTPVEATLVSNQVNQVIQFFEDTNGDGTPDYNYTGHLLFKGFLTGYYQARWDVINDGGVTTLEPYEYNISLTQDAIAGTTGDQTITITTLTDHTGSPISVGGKSFDYELVDPGTNTAVNLLAQHNYNVYNAVNTSISGSLYTSYQAFDLPDLLVEAGSNIETERGYFEGDGAVTDLSGVYCSRSAADHPGVSRFQSNDGTYYTPADTVQWTAASFLDGTRVRLYNVTQAAEIDNSVVSGGGGYAYTLVPATDFNSGDQITMLATYQSSGTAKLPFRFSTTVTTADVLITDSQTDWDNPGPNTLGIDGSTVSECATDYVGVQVEVTDSDDTTQKSRIAAFVVDAITTADGIRNWVALDGSSVITYSTNAAAQIDATVATVEVINQKTTSTLSVKDSFEFDWSDGVDRVSAVSGSSIIWLAPDRVLLEETGVSGLTASESSQLATISTVDSNVDLLIQDQGLDSGNPKTITENTEGTSYDETFGSVTKEIRRSGSTTTITRTT